MFKLDDSPVDAVAFQKMMASLAHRGEEGSHFFIRDGIGFGHHHFAMTRDIPGDAQPLYIENLGIAVTGDIRLDNRENLLPWLGLKDKGENVPDSRIVLYAYEKWGIGMVERLRGQYAFAVWDGRAKTLYLVTDHTGTRSVFYHKGEKVFIFATEIKGIHGSGIIARTVDKENLAVHLALPLTNLVLPEKTFFTGITSMCAAHVLKVTRTSFAETRYWIPDIRKRMKIGNEAEWREAFQEIFFRVVNANLRSGFPVAALLSGGLDSSSIVATAARLMQKKGSRLTTLSSVASEKWAGHVTDERYYINQFRGSDNVDMHCINDDRIGPFSGMEGWNADSPFRTSRHFLYSAICGKARELGVRVILEGAMGEHGPTFHGAGCLADSFRKGNFLYVMREIYRLSRVEGRRPLSLIKSHLIRPWLPVKVQTRSVNLQVFRSKGVRKEFIETWAHPDLIGGVRQELASFFADHVNHRKNQAAVFLRKKACIPRNSSLDFNSVEFRYPFMNPDLIEFCLATPEHFKIRNGYKRHMIRIGLDGVLPRAIQFRTCKEPFSPDYHFRFIQQIEMAKTFLSEIAPADPVHEIVDVQAVNGMLGALNGNRAAVTNREMGILFDIPMLIYLAYFLKKNLPLAP
jgi:asparagine synthase (glutamine-hydrolysing)